MARTLRQCVVSRMQRGIGFNHACFFCLIAILVVEIQYFLVFKLSSTLFIQADRGFVAKNQHTDQPSSAPTLISLKTTWWSLPTYPPSKLASSVLPTFAITSSSGPVERVGSSSPTLISTHRPSLAVPSATGRTAVPSSQQISTSSPQLASIFPSMVPTVTRNMPSLNPTQIPSLFSPSRLLSASPTMEEKSSLLPSSAPASAAVGDGWCDNGDLNLPDLNTADCNYDGGDCCIQSCKSGRSFACGTAGFSCLNPRYSNESRSSNFTLLFLIANFSLVQSNDGSTPDEKATQIALSALTYIAIEQQPLEFLGSASSEQVSVVSRVNTVLTRFDGRLVGDVEVVITTYFNSTSNNQQRRLQQQQQQDEAYAPTTIEFNLQRSIRYIAQLFMLPSLSNVIVCSNRTAAKCITRAEPAPLVKQKDASFNASSCRRSEGTWRTWYGSPQSLPAYLVLLTVFSAFWLVIALTLFGCLTLFSQLRGKGLSAGQVIRNLTWLALSIAAVLRFLCNIWILLEADLFAGARDREKLAGAACYEFAYLSSNSQTNANEIDKSNTPTLPLYVLALTLFYCVFAAMSVLRSLQRVMEENMSFERQRGYFANVLIASLILCILIILNVLSAILWAAGVYSAGSTAVLAIVALTQAICGMTIMLHSFTPGSVENAILCAVGVLYIITSYPDVVSAASAAFWLSSLLCRALEILWAMLYLKTVLNTRQRSRGGKGFAPTIVHALPMLKNNSLESKRLQRQRMARYVLVSDRVSDDLEECNHPEWIQEWIAQEEEKDAIKDRTRDE